MSDFMRKPLKVAWFHILLALSDGAQHGFAIREMVDVRTHGSVKLWPATLYGSIRDLVEGAPSSPWKAGTTLTKTSAEGTTA